MKIFRFTILMQICNLIILRWQGILSHTWLNIYGIATSYDFTTEGNLLSHNVRNFISDTEGIWDFVYIPYIAIPYGKM